MLNDFTISNDSTHEPDSLKFFLYLRNKEITIINQVLKKTLNLSVLQRDAWKEEHGAMMDSAIDVFIENANKLLKNLSLDEEILDLSYSLILSLQEATKMIEAIYTQENKLVS